MVYGSFRVGDRHTEMAVSADWKRTGTIRMRGLEAGLMKDDRRNSLDSLGAVTRSEARATF